MSRAGQLARSLLRQDWLFAGLFCVGLGLRVVTVVSYRPALFYIDTVRYLYDSGGNDPVGYRLPLKVILAIGNFDLVAVAQHLLGLAMAVAIYLVLVRAGTARWLAAIAATPVLLDAYQIQMEQMILPDVWFEALIVAGIAVLLSWGRAAQPSLRAIVGAGIAFGVAVTFRQVGEILLIPGLVYLVLGRGGVRGVVPPGQHGRGGVRGVAPPGQHDRGGMRVVLARCAVFVAAFAVPVLGYMTGSYLLVGHFYLSHSGVTTTYGRMAWSADCATLRLPAVERGLCPTATERAQGPDWLEHAQTSPIRRYYTGPLRSRASSLVSSFNKAVLGQQPTRVLGSYGDDVIKLFAPSKVTSPGDTPVARWQFQTSYPYLSPHATAAQVLPAVARYGGGRPTVWRPGAAFLRGYQLGGGYTPGPLLAFCVLAGIAGTVAAFRRNDADPGRLRLARRQPARDQPAHRQLAHRQLALACLLFFGCGGALLLMSDVFEFSWRYQLPALVTLPPAAAAAIAGIVRQFPPARLRTPEGAAFPRRSSLRSSLLSPGGTAPFGSRNIARPARRPGPKI